ncbi:MAG: gluzincin family metallopeptidase, partial [Planctomycetota bacterium]
MTATVPSFSSIDAETPDYDSVATEYAALEAELDAASDAAGRKAALERWDGLLRGLDTWHSLTHLRFNQDTTNEEYKQARDFCDELSPKLTDLAVKLQRKLVAAGYRGELEAAFGAHAFALWQADIDSFDPAIEEPLTQESKLCAKYVELLATAKLEIQGETVNLSGIRKFTTHADREIRHEAQRLRWGFFEENAEELDSIFDQLVELRHGMAKTLGFDSFTELGYRRM